MTRLWPRIIGDIGFVVLPFLRGTILAPAASAVDMLWRFAKALRLWHRAAVLAV